MYSVKPDDAVGRLLFATTTAKYGNAIAPNAGITVTQPACVRNNTTVITKHTTRMPIITRYRRSR